MLAKTWLPVFHLFVFSTKLAFTFQPSSFQLTLTARSTKAYCYTKNHLYHRSLITLGVVSCLGHKKSASFLYQFLSFFKENLTYSYTRRARCNSNEKLSKIMTKKPWPFRNARFHSYCTKNYVNKKDPPKFLKKFQRVKVPKNQRDISPKIQRYQELLAKTWKPAPHLSGSSTESARTSQPSPPQPTLTARSTPLAPRT